MFCPFWRFSGAWSLVVGASAASEGPVRCLTPNVHWPHAGLFRGLFALRVTLGIGKFDGLFIADVLGVTERRAFGIVNDLTEAGYVVKEKDGRRNRYRIQNHLPLPAPIGREPTVGEAFALFATQHRTGTGARPG